jgi:hypothetical protein
MRPPRMLTLKSDGRKAKNRTGLRTMKRLSIAVGLLVVCTLCGSALVFGAENLNAPAKEVCDHYIAIQEELAKDSTKGIGEHAAAIAAAAKSGQVKGLPADTEKNAETLAKAKDIKSARLAFKPLSSDFIKYRADDKAAKSAYHEAFCPMARAGWLQTGKEIRNPYYGKSMLDCGELRN